jgi:hypothetical protein
VIERPAPFGRGAFRVYACTGLPTTRWQAPLPLAGTPAPHSPGPARPAFDTALCAGQIRADGRRRGAGRGGGTTAAAALAPQIFDFMSAEGGLSLGRAIIWHGIGDAIRCPRHFVQDRGVIGVPGFQPLSSSGIGAPGPRRMVWMLRRPHASTHHPAHPRYVAADTAQPRPRHPDGGDKGGPTCYPLDRERSLPYPQAPLAGGVGIARLYPRSSSPSASRSAVRMSQPARCLRD